MFRLWIEKALVAKVDIHETGILTTLVLCISVYLSWCHDMLLRKAYDPS